MAPLILAADGELVTRIVTVMNRRPERRTAEPSRCHAQRNDGPLARREGVLDLLSGSYYQHWQDFSLELTASFPAQSSTALLLVALGTCTMRFEQSGQRFDVRVRPRVLPDDNPMREATVWYHRLFNPALSADCIIIGFAPDWASSAAEPPVV